MRQMKRLTAVLLLVSLLASFVVPAGFADNAQRENITYDFRLYANEALIAVEKNGAISTKNTTFNTAYDGTNRVYNWVVDNYSTLGWGFENAVGTNAAANKSFEFRNSGNSNQGMRMLIPNASQWAAIRINVPAAGTYAIEAVATQDNLAYTADMYIFPATTEYTSYDNRTVFMSTILPLRWSARCPALILPVSASVLADKTLSVRVLFLWTESSACLPILPPADIPVCLIWTRRNTSPGTIWSQKAAVARPSVRS